MTRYGGHPEPVVVSQRHKAAPEQVKNSAGGYTFAADIWARLDRFLILGCEGGTYYATETKLAKEAASAIRLCLKEDYPRALKRIIEVSAKGLALKNEPAIYALAVACEVPVVDGAPGPNDDCRRLARAAIPLVCRTGTHLLHFVDDIQKWNAGMRSAIGAWYDDKSPDQTAFQVAKYQQRDGWSQRDVLRLAHVKPKTIQHHAVYRFVTGGGSEALRANTKRGAPILEKYLPPFLKAVEDLHSISRDAKLSLRVAAACELIANHRIPHECVPNELKGEAKIWRAMLPSMGLTALIRNLGKMTSVGLLKPLSEELAAVCDALTNDENLKKARVHPIRVLIALKQYQMGRGLKGKLTWTPEARVLEALNTAFYKSFEYVVPTGKKIFLALDVSGSMDSAFGETSLTSREISACFAMVTAMTEKHWHCMAFTAPHGGQGHGGRWGGGSPTLTPVPFSPKWDLNQIIAATKSLRMGGTDCSLPMIYAAANRLDVDVFQIYTDNETWAGPIHPHVALKQYAKTMKKPDAKLVVLSTDATKFTIADPSDKNMLDVVGFSADTPAVISAFVREGDIGFSVDSDNEEM